MWINKKTVQKITNALDRQAFLNELREEDYFQQWEAIEKLEKQVKKLKKQIKEGY